MPKPLKKKPTAKSRPATKRPSPAADVRSPRSIANMDTRQPAASSTPPHGDPFEAQFRAGTSEAAGLDGKSGSTRRLETMVERRRMEIAKRAAAARGARKAKPGNQ
jgi:hypothetical protein